MLAHTRLLDWLVNKHVCLETTWSQRQFLLNYRLQHKTLPSSQFITDDLTARRAHLLYLCRQLKRAGVLQFVWTVDGRILVKGHGEHAHTVPIKCQSDLSRFDNAPAERMSSLSELDDSVFENHLKP